MGIDVRRGWWTGASAVIVALSMQTSIPVDAQSPDTHWVATWAMAPVARPPAPDTSAAADASLDLRNRTLRQIVRVSAGGSRVRIAVSNLFGTSPLTIGAASIAMRGREASSFPGTTWDVTFEGRDDVTIPAGATRLSDPVNLEVFRLTDLAIDLYLPDGIEPSSAVTMHGRAQQTSYISNRGNFAGANSFPVSATTESWFFLSRVDVESDATVGAVVAFGDSITDGFGSTLDANARWPNYLARRLAERDAPMAVVNTGIGGNRVLSDAPSDRPMLGVSALERFDRDVLEQPGVTHVIVLEGINDVGFARGNPVPRAEDIIAGHQELVRRAHAAGLRIYGATLLPFEGAAYFTQAGEAKRRAVNEWIRTSGAYDAVIDLDELTRVPGNPVRLRAEYDSGDHLHPSDAGYRAMGEAVDLNLFPPR